MQSWARITNNSSKAEKAPLLSQVLKKKIISPFLSHLNICSEIPKTPQTLFYAGRHFAATLPSRRSIDSIDTAWHGMARWLSVSLAVLTRSEFKFGFRTVQSF